MESISERRFRRKILKEEEKKSHWRFGIPIIVGLLILPHVVSNYLLGVIIGLVIAVIVAVGLNLLLGYAGQISLGHAAFVATGAYACAYSANHWGFTLIPALAFGAAAAGVMGLIIGIPALRIKGLYLAVATMGFSFIVMEVIDRLKSITGGAGGISVKPATVLGYRFEADIPYYYLALFCSLCLVIAAKNLSMSATGRAFVAVRDSEEAAQANGISVFRTKILAFVVSSMYAGIAGGLWAFYLRFISPENFTLYYSIEYVVMVVVGGMMSIYGSVLGALVIGFLPHLVVIMKDVLPTFLAGALPWFPGFVAAVKTLLNDAGFRYLIYGCIMLVFLLYEPAGIYGIWLRFKFYWKRFPFNRQKVRFKGKRMLLYRSYR